MPKPKGRLADMGTKVDVVGALSGAALRSLTMSPHMPLVAGGAAGFGSAAAAGTGAGAGFAGFAGGAAGRLRRGRPRRDLRPRRRPRGNQIFNPTSM